MYQECESVANPLYYVKNLTVYSGESKFSSQISINTKKLYLYSDNGYEDYSSLIDDGFYD